MALKSLAIVGLTLAVLGACGDGTVSRNTTAATLSPTEDHRLDHSVLEQTEALNFMLKDLERQSTVKGAAGGALIGCVVSVITGTGTRGCVGTAVVGGAVGGLVGRANGKAKAARRVEIISTNNVSRSLLRSNDQVDVVQTNLPQLLAAQNRELLELGALASVGRVSDDTYQTRKLEIAKYRRDLTEALTLSEKQARQVTKNLEDAAAQGQTGLDWHMGQTRKIADDVASARTEVSLL